MDPFTESNREIRSERWVSLELTEIVLDSACSSATIKLRVSLQPPDRESSGLRTLAGKAKRFLPLPSLSRRGLRRRLKSSRIII